MSYKKTDALMKHLRNNGININGSVQKRQLINTGYFHGYKGYRFFRSPNNRLPFISYDEIHATIQYDSALKSLFYSKLMFIETAVKNIALESILIHSNSENIHKMYDKVIISYKTSPDGISEETRKKHQKNKLKLQTTIQSNLSRAYCENNAKITHFYNHSNYGDVPLWALFEILTMGNFGTLLSRLTYSVRDDISKNLGINLSTDTNRELIYKYIYTLKDLRNAVAHNSVIFDTRFARIEPSKAMKQCLKIEFNLPYINFKTIGDYFILVFYYLKLLKVPKRELKLFIKDFDKIINEYKKSVNANVISKVIHPDLSNRIKILKNFV